jgi:hypothetical protein
MRAVPLVLAALVLAATVEIAVAQQPIDEAISQESTEGAANAPPAPAEGVPTPAEGAPAPATDDAAVAGTKNPNPLSTLTLDELAATRELPLFTPSRTAPVVDAPVVEEPVVAAPAEPAPTPEQPPPPVQLIGIILTDAKQTAILRNSSTDEVLRLSPGEQIENWALTIVDARSIELRQGERVEGLKMFDSFPVSSVPAELGGDGLPTDMSGEYQPPPENPEGEMQPAPSPEEMPSADGFQESPDSPSGEPSETGSSPVPDANSGTNFAPELGNSPIPDEGAPPPEEEGNVNQ